MHRKNEYGFTCSIDNAASGRRWLTKAGESLTLEAKSYNEPLLKIVVPDEAKAQSRFQQFLESVIEGTRGSAPVVQVKTMKFGGYTREHDGAEVVYFKASHPLIEKLFSSNIAVTKDVQSLEAQLDDARDMLANKGRRR